jgi:PAS domain S-box-containing protein
MGRTPPSILSSYGGAVVFTALAVLLRWLLDPILDANLPFCTLYGVVAVAVWYGGYRPALLATALGYLAVNYLFIEPRGTLLLKGMSNVIGLLAYLLSCSLIIGFGEAMRSTRRRADAGEQAQSPAGPEAASAAGDGRLWLAVEAAGMGTWDMDLNTGKAYWSKTYFQMLGYHPQPGGEATLEMWSSRLHPDDKTRVLEAFHRARQERSLDAPEHRIIRADNGQIVWESVFGRCLCDETGKSARFIGIFVDNTERHRVEDDLRHSEQRFRSLLSATTSIIWSTDEAGRFVTEQPSWAAYTGQTWAQYRDFGWIYALHPDDQDGVRRLWEEAHSTRNLAEHQGRVWHAVSETYHHFAARGVPITNADGSVREWVGKYMDVEDRTRTEEALRAVAQQFQIVTESMAAPVTRCSCDFRYLWVSKPYADWIGRPPDEIVGRPIIDILGPEAFDQLRPRFEQVLAGEKVQYEEQVNFRGLGLRWTHAIYTPTFDKAGVPDGWVAVVLDITERRHMEEALRDSEQRFARFMNHLPGLAWIKDLEGRYVYANEAAVKVFRCSSNGLYGKTDDEVFPPETAAQFKSNDGQALQSGAGVQVIETLEHEDGLVHHSVVSKFPILGPNGRPALVGGMAVDITDLKQAEEALRQSEGRLRLALEAGRMGVWDWNIRTNEVTWSDNLEAIHGLAPGTFGGTLEAFQQLIHPDDRELVRRAIARALAEQSSYDMEFRIVRPDGSVHWMAGKGKVFTDNGQPARMVGVGMDITARKRVEQNTRFLADASATLAALVDYQSTLHKVAQLAVRLSRTGVRWTWWRRTAPCGGLLSPTLIPPRWHWPRNSTFATRPTPPLPGASGTLCGRERWRSFPRSPTNCSWRPSRTPITSASCGRLGCGPTSAYHLPSVARCWGSSRSSRRSRAVATPPLTSSWPKTWHTGRRSPSRMPGYTTRFGRPTVARTSFWPLSPTSFATRWPRSVTHCKS